MPKILTFQFANLALLLANLSFKIAASKAIARISTKALATIWAATKMEAPKMGAPAKTTVAVTWLPVIAIAKGFATKPAIAKLDGATMKPDATKEKDAVGFASSIQSLASATYLYA